MSAKKKRGSERLGMSPREARVLRQGPRASARLPGAEGPRMPGGSRDDAQKRAEQFNAAERIAELEFLVETNTVARRVVRSGVKKQLLAAAERIAELEAEVTRLRAALREIMDLDPDQSFADFVRETERISMLGLAKKPTKKKRTAGR